MDVLNKNQVINTVANKTGQSKKDTTETVNVLLDVIADEIKSGKKINFTGFGSFLVVERKGRTGHNPRTGEKLDIPATKVPKFRAGAVLKQTVK